MNARSIVARKSMAMREHEAAYLSRTGVYRSIEEIIADALRVHDSDQDAAIALGLSKSVLSTWISKLAMLESAFNARADRRARDTKLTTN